MSDDKPLPRFCRETQAQLPFLVSGELTGWPARVVRGHLKRCADCRAELERQEQLTGALQSLRSSPPAPPAGLLEDLLAKTRPRGLRARAAVPARGAGVPNPIPDRPPETLIGTLLLLAGPGSDYINGQTIIVDGGRNMRL